MNPINPFLDNIETVGISKPMNKTGNFMIPEKALFNRKRGNKISNHARKNVKAYSEVSKYIMDMDSEARPFNYMINLRNKLQNCCTYTMVRLHKKPSTIEFIGAHTCKHKLCHVCNYERSKVLRRKYLNYFNKNEFIDKTTGEVSKKSDFDFMHLTLTVPHSENNGFRGKRWYADELMKEFNYLRKKAYWQKFVFAGEFGVEVTKNANGLHIHIHSLLIIRKFPQSRNLLHRWILKNWNMQTVCPASKREKFTEDEKNSIKKGNKLFADNDLNALNPQGSTLIGLESLYTYSGKKLKATDKWNQEKGMWKHYVNAEEERDFMAGIMECIKYHFEPLCLNQHDGTFDFDLLCEILPAIQGKPLYRKFGNFHGVKELNINENVEENITELLAEVAKEQVIHPETEQPVNIGDYSYCMLSAKSIFYDIKNNYKPFIKRSAKKSFLPQHTLKEALQYMTQLSWRSQVKAKDKKEVEFLQFIPDIDEFSLN